MQLNGMAGAEHMHILYSAIASVLAGSVWGDHCSPISDTTILSSQASGCHHLAHVATQLPYALLVAVVSVEEGDLFFYVNRFWVDEWSGMPSLKHKLGQKMMGGEMRNRIERHEICR